MVLFAIKTCRKQLHFKWILVHHEVQLVEEIRKFWRLAPNLDIFSSSDNNSCALDSAEGVIVWVISIKKFISRDRNSS